MWCIGVRRLESGVRLGGEISRDQIVLAFMNAPVTIALMIGLALAVHRVQATRFEISFVEAGARADRRILGLCSRIHGSVARGCGGFGRVYRDPKTASALSRATLRRCDLPAVRPVVPAILLSYRDLKEIMAERNLSVDHVTIWRWVQRYAPVLNQRLRREMRHPNRSWRVDETYVKVAGNWAYLYRAVDSAGETIEFMLSPTAI